MLSCEYCDFFKSSFFYRTPPLSTSKSKLFRTYICYILFSKPFKVLKCFFLQQTLHKKWSFPLRISSVNVTKSAGNWGFGHIYWRNPLIENFIFCAVKNIIFKILPCCNKIYLLWDVSILKCLSSLKKILKKALSHWERDMHK